MIEAWTEVGDYDRLSEQPLVSVVMITYNHELYLAQAVDSIVNQQVDFEIEILIGEDASSDSTRQVAIEYQKRYPQLIKVLYSNNNVGMAQNFARSLGAAKGKYIALCEGDDYWVDPLKLQKQVQFLENNEDYVVCYTDYRAFNSHGVLGGDTAGIKRDLSRRELQWGQNPGTLTVCFRNVLETLPPEFLAARICDRFLCSLLGSFGEGKYIDEIQPAMYRVHSGGVVSQKSVIEKKDMWLITLNCMYAYYRRIGNAELSDYFFNESIKICFTKLGATGLFKSLVELIREKILSGMKLTRP